MKAKMSKADNYCIAHARVSSLKQSSEGESLEVQENTLKRFADLKEFKIFPNGQVFKSTISGRKLDRGDFEEIFDLLKKNPGVVKFYIFRSIDRFTRAGTGEYERLKAEFAKYGVQMLDTNGVIQPSKNTLEEFGQSYSWSVLNPSEITENVMATTAKHEVNTILTRMLGQEIRLTQQGYRTRRPTDGYKNKKIFVEGKKKTIQEPDPDRAKFFIAMFELRAQGRLSDAEIVEQVNAMGYGSPIQNKWSKDRTKILSQRGGTPLTIKLLQRNIQNTLYAGVLCEKWTHYKPVRAQYAGLVSVDTFNRANRGKLTIKELPDGSFDLVRSTGELQRNRNNPLFPYKCILCPFCRKPFTASSPRGKSGKRFPKYHCSRDHAYYGVNKADLDSAVESFISSLNFSPQLTEAIELTFLNKYREREKEIVDVSSTISRNIAELEERKSDVLQAIIATKIPEVREGLEHDYARLDVRLKSARTQRQRIEITEDDIHSFTREVKRVMEHPSEILLNPDDIRLQRDLLGLVFEEMPTYSELVNGTPKMSWIFKLSENFKPDKAQLVTSRGIEPRFDP